MPKKEKYLPRSALLLIPISVYILSYLYLAYYHGEVNLISTIVHEGGIYTLLETTLYASHFLGHIPVHTVLSLYFIGVYLCMSEVRFVPQSIKKAVILLVGMVLFLAVSWLISIEWFGPGRTYSYILQQKQSVVRFEQGGSWNLHLPSTMMQFLLIPLFIYSSKILFQSKIVFNKSGLPLAVISVLLCFFMTWLVYVHFISAMEYVWVNARYLAHSVRELATFPLTYYPIPLYFMFKYSGQGEGNWSLKKVPKPVIVLAVFFILLFIYQAVIPLQEGIGELAQKPSFAKGGELSIAYLLSSHYFEHFLDTIYFSLFCLILFFFYQNRAKTNTN